MRTCTTTKLVPRPCAVVMLYYWWAMLIGRSLAYIETAGWMKMNEKRTNERAAAFFQGEGTVDIKKPLHDRNEYKYIELPNLLRAVVISVPECDRAAASITVHAGAHSDRDDVAGSAHLVEHMLFLGSKKYPDPKDYAEFIFTNGGTTNAHTAAEETTFFFEISPALLAGALDRLAQGFSAPLLRKDGVENEVNAIQGEFNYRKTLDSRRLHMILSQVPRLPHLGKFTTGNLETLLHGPRSRGIEPYEVMKEFHATWYSANLMTLAVAGKETVEELEALVSKLFGEIPNFNKTPPRFPRCSVDYLPFPPGSLDTFTYVVPVATLHQAIFAFYIPPTSSMLETKPYMYIDALLQDNCKTCLAAKLKDEGLISSLHTKITNSESCSRIELVLNLTDKGEVELQRIGELVFTYLRYMAATPVEKWRWKELQDLAKVAFDYHDQPNPADMVTDISVNLMYYPPSEVLRGSKYSYYFDKEGISSLIKVMNSSNARILLVDKKYEPMCKDELSGYPVRFAEKPAPAAITELWQKIDALSDAEIKQKMKEEHMALPGPNPFIPTDLAIKKPPLIVSPFPERLRFPSNHICGKGVCGIFFKQDTKFNVPKATATLVLYFVSSALEHERDALMAKVLAASLNMLLDKELSAAERAGYRFKVKAGVEKTSTFLRQVVRPTGLTLYATGYSQRLCEVLRAVAAVISRHRHESAWKEVLPIAIESVRKKLRAEVYVRTPVRQASDALAYLFVHPNLNDQRFVEYAEKELLTAELVEAWSDIKLHKLMVAVDGLIQGNLKDADAAELVDKTLGELKLRGIKPYHQICNYQVFDMRNVVPALEAMTHWVGVQRNEKRAWLPTRLRYAVNNILPTDEQNGISFYIHMGWPSLQRRALILLAILWFRDKFFFELRTKQQLGYIVSFTAQNLEHTRYLLLTVTSVYDGKLVCERIEAFLNQQLKSPLTHEEFQTIYKAGIDLNQVKDKSLPAEYAFNFDQVVMREFIFDLREQMIEQLRALNVSDFNKFLAEELAENPRIAIVVQARTEGKLLQAGQKKLEYYQAGQWRPIPQATFSGF